MVGPGLPRRAKGPEHLQHGRVVPADRSASCPQISSPHQSLTSSLTLPPTFMFNRPLLPSHHPRPQPNCPGQGLPASLQWSRPSTKPDSYGSKAIFQKGHQSRSLSNRLTLAVPGIKSALPQPIGLCDLDPVDPNGCTPLILHSMLQPCPLSP